MDQRLLTEREEQLLWQRRQVLEAPQIEELSIEELDELGRLVELLDDPGTEQT